MNFSEAAKDALAVAPRTAVVALGVVDLSISHVFFIRLQDDLTYDLTY